MSAVFPTVSTPFWAWIQEVARCMRDEAAALTGFPRASTSPKRFRSDFVPGTLADSIVSRSIALERCIRGVVGYVCSCGRPADGNAQLRGSVGSHLCHSRSCPRCSRIRSAQLREWGGHLAEHLKALKDTAEGLGVDFRLRLVTLTQEYKPWEADDLTVDALRNRWGRLREAWRHILSRVRSPLSKKARRLVGAWATVEMVGTGHVHMHVLYFGPWVDEDQWSDWGREVFPEFGHVDAKLASEGAVAQLAHYPVKSPGGRATRWFAGQPYFSENKKTGVLEPGLCHPRLMARWEIALFGKRIGDRYGSFRDVRAPEEVQVTEAETRPVKACPCCGRVEWQRVKMGLGDWVMRCDAHGVTEHLGNPRAVKRRE